MSERDDPAPLTTLFETAQERARGVGRPLFDRHQTTTAHAACDSPSTHPDSRPPATSPVAPTPTIPGYEILAELGRGGMGVVYMARQTALNRVVALKMVLHGEYASPEARRRFRTEAEAVARIQHPHIVQIFDVGEQDGRLFFSLEYCSAGSLAAQLNGEPQPPRQAARLVAMLARAVQAIHQQEIIHRDLKPANVLLTADGQPKVTDFGLARRLDQEGQTQTGAVMGTPSYMAPEQARGDTKQVGPAADVWALGAILYECLTGRSPFKAANTVDTLAQVLEQSPAVPRSLNPAIHRDLETVCLKCLEKDPGKRYGSAEELAEDLERYLRGEPVRARRVNSLVRGLRWVRRRPALLAFLLLLLLGTIGGGALWSWGDQHRRAAEMAERERDEAQRFVEALTPQRRQTWREFGEWLQQRPHLADMRAKDAFALYLRDTPDTEGFAPQLGSLPASIFLPTPNMIGD